MKELLDVFARALVSDPDSVDITEKSDEDGHVLLELRVAPDDMGKIIGKHGQVANAMRTVLKAVAGREGKKVSLEIV